MCISITRHHPNNDDDNITPFLAGVCQAVHPPSRQIGMAEVVDFDEREVRPEIELSWRQNDSV